MELPPLTNGTTGQPLSKEDAEAISYELSQFIKCSQMLAVPVPDLVKETVAQVYVAGILAGFALRDRKR